MTRNEMLTLAGRLANEIETYVKAIEAQRDRYAAALDEIQTLDPDRIAGPQSTLDRAKEIARKARERTGQ